MKKVILLIAVCGYLFAQPAYAVCETVYVWGSGYQTICYPDPSPPPMPTCLPSLGNCN